MTTTKVANFGFIKTDGFTLPGLQTVNGKTHLKDFEKIHVELPDDARDKAMLSFFFDTQKGDDDGIDVAFEVSVNGGSKHNFYFQRYMLGCLQLQMFGLQHGSNNVVFAMLKGGTVKAPDPDEALGGKGVVNFSNVCLTYHRDVVL